MRLIDADKIDFSKVFGGYSAFAKDLISAAQELIDIQPTAFDRKKVVEELQKHSHNYYPSIDHYCVSVKAVKLREVIEIVEKGRIE